MNIHRPVSNELRHFQLDDLDLQLDHHDALALRAMTLSQRFVPVPGFKVKHKVTVLNSGQNLKGLATARLWGVRFPKTNPQRDRATAAYFPPGSASLA